MVPSQRDKDFAKKCMIFGIPNVMAVGGRDISLLVDSYFFAQLWEYAYDYNKQLQEFINWINSYEEGENK